MITFFVWLLVRWGAWLGVWINPLPLSWVSDAGIAGFFCVLVDLVLIGGGIAFAINKYGDRRNWW